MRAGGSNHWVNLLVAPPCSRSGGHRLSESPRCLSSPGPARSRAAMSKTGRETVSPRSEAQGPAIAKARGQHQTPKGPFFLAPRAKSDEQRRSPLKGESPRGAFSWARGPNCRRHPKGSPRSSSRMRPLNGRGRRSRLPGGQRNPWANPLTAILCRSVVRPMACVLSLGPHG